MIICFYILGLNSCLNIYTKKEKSTYTNIQWNNNFKNLYKKHKKYIKIAIILPFSGIYKNISKSILQGAELSLFDTNINNISIIPIDTKGTKKGAIKAVQKAILKKTKLILGPLFSHETKAISNLFNLPPIISFSTDPSVIKPLNIFSIGINHEEQLKYLIKFSKKKQINTIAVILPKNSYGNYIQKILDKLNIRKTIKMIYYTQYNEKSLNLINIRKKLNNFSCQGLLIPEGGKRLYYLISSLKYNNIPLSKLQLLGTEQWNNKFLSKIKDISGGCFTAPMQKEKLLFIEHYKNIFHDIPHRIALLSYDAILMIASLIKLYKNNPFQYKNIIRKQGFWGNQGLFRFTIEGTIERGIAIFRINKDGLLKLIIPAIKSFRKHEKSFIYDRNFSIN